MSRIKRRFYPAFIIAKVDFLMNSDLIALFHDQVSIRKSIEVFIQFSNSTFGDMFVYRVRFYAHWRIQ